MRDCLGGPLAMQGMQIPSLVGGKRAHMPRTREACEPHSGVHGPQLQVRVQQQKIVHDAVKILRVQLRPRCSEDPACAAEP